MWIFENITWFVCYNIPQKHRLRPSATGPSATARPRHGSPAHLPLVSPNASAKLSQRENSEGQGALLGV